jgi:hypothetical protein
LLQRLLSMMGRINHAAPVQSQHDARTYHSDGIHGDLHGSCCAEGNNFTGQLPGGWSVLTSLVSL